MVKKQDFFNSKFDFSGHYFCSDDCKNKFWDKLNKEKEKDQEMQSEGMIKEIKCKCNKCGDVWYYLEEDEKKLKLNTPLLGSCGNCGYWTPVYRGIDLKRETDKIKKCPKCSSTDATKTPIYHAKRT